MSMRIHTANHDGWTAMGSLAVEIITNSEKLVELYGDNFADVDTPVLVIEDGGNQEAWVIAGDLADFMAQINKALNAYMSPPCTPHSVAEARPERLFKAPRVSDAKWETLHPDVRNALDPGSADGRFNEHGDYELTKPYGGLAIVHFTDEGIVADWFVDGEPIDTWAATWDDLTDPDTEGT